MTDNSVIREAGAEDEESIRDFIRLYWRNDHPLAHSKRLFDFQYKKDRGNKYSFIVAEEAGTKELYGILGFIPTFRYDNSLIKEKDYWGALFMVRTDRRKSGLGKRMWDLFVGIYGYSSFAAIGVSKYGLHFLQELGFTYGTLNHYYLLNESFTEFWIASGVAERERINLTKDEHWVIEHVNSLPVSGIDISSEYRPLKTIEFLRNRYAGHPFYRYSYLLIKCDEKPVAILVIRKINQNGNKVLRIVDCLGSLEVLPDLTYEFQKILNKESAEYIDLLNYGIDESTFIRMGFSELKAGDSIIIPNYFEPFERKYIRIACIYKSSFPYIVFKGDADQDRPNNLSSCKMI